jgi:tetratricopeptide (TPR) repeat protein
MLTEDYQGATRDLRQALELCRKLGDQYSQAFVLTRLGTVQRLTGNLHGARRDLETALDLFGRMDARSNQAWALNQYAAVIATTGDHTLALDLHRNAVRMARETQQLDEQALALEGIGECHLHTGDSHQGIEYLTQALAIFQHLAMRPDIERIEARLTELGER